MSKFESSPFVEKVHAYLNKHNITPQKGHLVVAVSGGVDSMVLLHVLHRLNYQLHVVHVNYHQRDTSSDLDQALVEKTCETLGLSYKTYHYPTKMEGNSNNFQDEARQFRHQILETEFDHEHAQAIALGHNKGDRLETILMRILRGASPANWDALKAVDHPRIRPLIDLDRSQIQEYALDNQIPWRDDESNFESDYSRNFIRNNFFSGLDSLFPGWDINLERVASYGLMYQQALDALSNSNEKSKIQLNHLNHHPLELQMALVHRFLERNGLRPSVGQVQQVQKLLHSQAGKELSINDVKVVRDTDALVIISLEIPSHTTEYVIPIQTILEEGYEDDLMIIKKISGPELTHSSAYLLPLPKTDFILRSWKVADRIAIKGGSKRISDLLNEWDIPARQKSKALVLTLEGTIIACIFSSNSLRPLIRLAPQSASISYPCLELYLKP